LQMGLNQPAEQPSEFPTPDPSIARANNMLHRWAAEKNPAPPGMPEGLSPQGQRAYAERYQRLSGTSRGKQQLLQEELGGISSSNAAEASFARQAALKNLESDNSFRNQQSVQDRKDHRGEAMAAKHQQWRREEAESRKAVTKVEKPNPDSPWAMFMGGKEIKPDKAPPHPMGFVPDEHIPGIGVYHDGKGGAHPLRMDEKGQFRKLDDNSNDEDKYIKHQMVKNEETGAVEHHIINTKTGRYTVAKPESEAPAAIQYERGPDGSMRIKK